MRIIVFGATGKTGRLVCRAATDAGHRVTAFGRSVERLDQPELEVHRGDVFDRASVEQAAAGHDAAIVCLGSTNLRDKTTLSTGTGIVVDAMVAKGVKRLIVMSAAGVGDSWQQIPLLSKLLFRTMLRNVLADHEGQERVVTESPLDWTIVRAGILKDDQATGHYTTTTSDPITRITRADVAACLVDQLDDPGYRHQVVSVTN